MPNGRNAGRLFPDCTNEHGHGEWHRLSLLDGSNPGDAVGVKVRCVHCAATGKLIQDPSAEGGRRFVKDESDPPDLPEAA